MSNLMAASHQWSSRPEDERFTSLTDLRNHFAALKASSVGKALSTRDLSFAPVEDDPAGLVVVGPNGNPCIATHWSFGQACQRAGAPAGYLRELPSDLAADALNYGLRARDVEDIGVLLRKPEGQPPTLAAVTGPGYGRVWNATIADALVKRFGDGVTGDFRVPGEFGKGVAVTKSNTTIYGSDRDMFVFLADEEHRIEVPGRRDGKSGSMARGFFLWNSEVGAQTFGVATFLFDYVCCNRIVWGAQGYEEIRIRHTSSAPHRWIEEVEPAVRRYAMSSTQGVQTLLLEAKKHKIGDEGKVMEFLGKRFTRTQARGIAAAHLQDEGRPIETLWDATVGATAYARNIPYQDERVKVEREAGKILNMAV